MDRSKKGASVSKKFALFYFKIKVLWDVSDSIFVQNKDFQCSESNLDYISWSRVEGDKMKSLSLSNLVFLGKCQRGF